MEATDAQCQLLVGSAAIAAQLLLVAIVILGLLYKRNKEVPQRPLLVWGMDVSKQLVSSGMAHILGMLIAILAQLRATQQITSECSWYFVTFSVDTTLGVVLVLTMHNTCVRVAKGQVQKMASSCQSEVSSSEEEEMADDMEQHLTDRRLMAAPPDDSLWIWESIADCGNYGAPPSATKWAIQLAQFSVCVVVARTMCGSVVITAAPVLAHVAATLDAAFHGHPTLLLYFVMVACPVLMNTGQAWVQDQFLKWGAWGPGGAGPPAPRRSDDGDQAWEELGHLSESMLSLSGDLEKAPVAGKVAPAQIGEKAARAAVAHRQNAPAGAAGSDRRARLPHV